MILSVADVDLSIASAPQGGQVLAVRFTAPQQPSATLARDVPVHLDHAELLSLSNDPDEYGEALTAQLFRDAAAHGAWARLRAFADGAGVTLRVRLHLDRADALTQGLRWETLHDPERDVPLALSERAVLSRLVDSDALTGPLAPDRPDLRATIAVASPSDLAAYGLALIDADGEIARARAALGAIPAITVGAHAEEPASRMSLANLLAGLRTAPHVLLLICHGREVAGETYLCLENAEGRAAWLPAQHLVEALRELPQLPLLAVLVACKSGGSGYGPSLAALGPQLARAGVPAVIAFQGDVPISAVRQMLGPLFGELRRDGIIDRALAVARRHGAGASWWQPALWLRSPDGRLWREPLPDRSTQLEAAGPVLSGTFYGPVVVNAPVTVHQYAPPPEVSAAQVAAGAALLQQIPVSPPDPLPEPAALPQPHRMPLAANRYFVGREAELGQLADPLRQGEPVAITGIGGVGKTQLAVELVHRYGRFFAGGVFWLNFANPSGIADEVVACGGSGALELFRRDENLTREDQIARVFAAWQTDLPRLLVFDNCESEALLDQWRPKSGACRLIITSRRAQWDPLLIPAQLALNVLERPASVALLRLHTPELDALAAEKVGHALGDLPLALHLAGSFLRRYRTIDAAEYLAQLERADLLSHPSLEGRAGGVSPTGQTLHVARAFALSYERLDMSVASDGLAADLLAGLAWLSPGALIPRPFVRAILHECAQPGANVLDDLAVFDIEQRLTDLGFVEVAQDDALRMHRLVSRFVRRREVDPERIALQRAARALRAEVKRIEAESDLYDLLPYHDHIGVLAAALADGDVELFSTLKCAEAQVRLLQGDFAAALPILEQTLERAEQELPAHPVTADLLNHLAGWHYEQGDADQAQALIERALRIREQALGPEHPETLGSMQNLALLLEEQGAFGEAQALLAQVLEGTRRAYGPKHLAVAEALDNLARALLAGGDPIAALEHAQAALALREQLLEPEHPLLAFSLQTLAQIAGVQGEAAKAAALLVRAAQIVEGVLGAESLEAAGVYRDHGEALLLLDDRAGAAEKFQQALAIYLALFGEEHPEAAEIRRRLAALGGGHAA